MAEDPPSPQGAPEKAQFGCPHRSQGWGEEDFQEVNHEFSNLGCLGSRNTIATDFISVMFRSRERDL